MRFKLQVTSVLSTLPWIISLSFIFYDISRTRSWETIEHGFDKSYKSTLTKTIALADCSQALVKSKIKIREYAKVFNMTSNQFHSVISSPINACIPVRIMAALSSSLPSDANTKRINSPFSEMSFL